MKKELTVVKTLLVGIQVIMFIAIFTFVTPVSVVKATDTGNNKRPLCTFKKNGVDHYCCKDTGSTSCAAVKCSGISTTSSTE